MSDPVAEAQELLVDTIETFEKLEVVRLLARVEPQTIDTISVALAMSPPIVRETLRELQARGIIVEQAGAWWLDSRSPKYAATRELVKIYDQDRVGVMNRMTKIALERIRVNAARTFADAFVLRPKKKEED